MCVCVCEGMILMCRLFVCFSLPVASTGVDVHSIFVRMPKQAVVVGVRLAGSPIKAVGLGYRANC